MFKYIRTMNSSENAPEITMLRTTNDQTFYEGEICTINEVGYLTTSLFSGTPKYLVKESKKIGDGKSELRCIRILEGMLFEADLASETFEILEKGKTFNLSTDANGHNLFVGSTMGNDVEIISKLNYPYEQKVVVTFI